MSCKREIIVNYVLKARIYPALLCMLPFLVFYYYYLNNKTSGFLEFIAAVSWIDDAIYITIVIYLFSQVSRFIGKELFENKIFKNGLGFPTTTLLTHDSSIYSKEYQKSIIAKIKDDFNIDIILEKTGMNDIEERKKITEAVSHIRVNVGDGRLVLQHNIEYGFARNLVGGAMLAFFISCFNILFFWNFEQIYTAFVVSIVIATLYLVIVLFSKHIILRYGYLYARILYQEYMNL